MATHQERRHDPVLDELGPLGPSGKEDDFIACNLCYGEPFAVPDDEIGRSLMAEHLNEHERSGK